MNASEHQAGLHGKQDESSQHQQPQLGCGPPRLPCLCASNLGDLGLNGQLLGILRVYSQLLECYEVPRHVYTHIDIYGYIYKHAHE